MHVGGRRGAGWRNRLAVQQRVARRGRQGCGMHHLLCIPVVCMGGCCMAPLHLLGVIDLLIRVIIWSPCRGLVLHRHPHEDPVPPGGAEPLGAVPIFFRPLVAATSVGRGGDTGRARELKLPYRKPCRVLREFVRFEPSHRWPSLPLDNVLVYLGVTSYIPPSAAASRRSMQIASLSRFGYVVLAIGLRSCGPVQPTRPNKGLSR